MLFINDIFGADNFFFELFPNENKIIATFNWKNIYIAASIVKNTSIYFLFHKLSRPGKIS